jgi:hypothetical protein
MKFQNFLVESKRRKIYFAHPRAFYNKPEEKKAEGMIMKKFPEHIIVNPNVNWIQGRVEELGFDIFFKVINTVEFICAMPFPDGKMGNGTWREIEYADKKGKDIYVVNPWKNTLELTPKSKIKWLSPEETYYRIPKKEQDMWLMYEEELKGY